MLCFEVSVNGNRLCKAGVGEYGVLTAILTWVWSQARGDDSPEKEERRKTADLHVGGLQDGDHVDWLENRVLLGVGDEVAIKVIETQVVDEPTRRERQDDPEIAKRNRYFLYQAYKREFEAAGEGGILTELSPEAARELRHTLYEEYRAEFEGARPAI